MPKFDLLQAAPDLADLAAEIGATVHHSAYYVNLPPYGGLWSSRSEGPIAKSIPAIRARLAAFVATVKAERAKATAFERAQDLLGRLDKAGWLQPGYGCSVNNDAWDLAQLHRWPVLGKYDADATIDGVQVKTELCDSREAALAELRRLVEERWPPLPVPAVPGEKE